MTHPWIESRDEFEVVFSSTAAIEDYEKAATIRAYQTYGFDNASTSEVQSFSHIETGVQLLHEGGLVAITFGDGQLVRALPDLVLVLVALGWKEAEIYHPEATMGQFLRDLGSAIPAHLDFDVRPAGSAAELPEARELVAYGASLLQNVADTPQAVSDFHRIAMDELSSMGADTLGESNPVQGHADPITLDEQLDDDLASESASAQHVNVAPSYPAGSSVFVDDLEAQPMIPFLGDLQEIEPIHLVDDIEVSLSEANTSAFPKSEDATAKAVPNLDSVVHTHEPTLTTMVEGASELAGAPVGDSHQEICVQQELPSQELALQPHHGQERHIEAIWSPTLLRIGQSAMCFDNPNEPVTLEDVDRFASEIKASEVVHIWPGLLNQSVRWDLLGEINPQAPWIAEVIAALIEKDQPIVSTCIAAVLSGLAPKAGAQLRDLLDQILAGKTFENFDDVPWLKGCMHVNQSFTHTVLAAFGSLLLAPAGQAFIDIRVETASESSVLNTFSVRGLVEEPTSKLYVIHVDAIDGPFVELIAKMLLAIGARYANSTRAGTQALAFQHEARRAESMRREQEKQQALVLAQEHAEKLRVIMQSAGITAADLRLTV